MNDTGLKQPPGQELVHQGSTIQYHPVAQTRLEVMARLQSETPKNDYGLPILIYDPTHVQGNFFSLDLNDQAEIASLAAVPIDYAEGFPTVDGNMMWERLSFEPIESYMALERYIKLEQSFGYRALTLLVGEMLPASTSPAKEALDRKLQEYREFYTYYSWSFRVKAYDMLHHVAYARRRERRAMDIEDFHYLKLEKIMGKLIARFDRYVEDDWNALAPDEAVRTLKELAQLQRVAAGLPAHGPQQQGALGVSNQGASIEQRLREVAQRNSKVDPAKSTVTETEQALRDDPEVMAMAQELIITMAKKTSPGQGQQTPESPRESANPDQSDEESN